MPDLDLDRLTARIRERRALERRALAAAIRPPVCAENRLACTFAPGTRVFDTVTGEEAIVHGGTVENVSIPTARR